MKNYWQYRWDRDKKLKRLYCFGKNVTADQIQANISNEIYKMNDLLAGILNNVNTVLDFGCGLGFYVGY